VRRRVLRRQKGALNRATAEARAAAEATGILPLDYMLSIMRDAKVEPKRCDPMAAAAAPYVHPKMSPVEAKPTEPPAEDRCIRVEFGQPRPRDDHDVMVLSSNGIG